MMQPHLAEISDMSAASLKECCLGICGAILSKLQENVLVPPPPPSSGADFSSRSTVGLLLNGTTIDQMVVGGPAFNSGQLHQHDTIIAIDGKPITAESIQAHLIGSDAPGSTVSLTVRRGHKEAAPKAPPNPLWFAKSEGTLPPSLRDPTPYAESSFVVVLTRMASEVIADRRRIAELFTILKVPACQPPSFLLADLVTILNGLAL